MTTPRLRRLAADYESVRAAFSGHPYVRVDAIGAVLPPERYHVTLQVPGLVLDGEQPHVVNRHEAEIVLPLGYPREPPYARPLTPIFHPNIRDHYCLQDYWAAGQPLVDTISKMADMIQFRTYNPGSPLDAIAARWSEQHPEIFPLGNIDVGTPEVAVSLRPPKTEELPITGSDAADSEDDLAITLRGGS